MIFVDNESMPVINGTGSEDFFCGSWDFGGREHAVPFSHHQYGAPLIRAPSAPAAVTAATASTAITRHFHALPEAHHGARPRQRPRR